MSDNEYLLDALVDGEPTSDFTPNTRFERMLKSCCTGEDCEVKPKTRNEHLLRELQNKLKNGGSGENVEQALQEDY